MKKQNEKSKYSTVEWTVLSYLHANENIFDEINLKFE